MRIRLILIFLFSVSSSLGERIPKEIATKLSLNPGAKAMMQWERVFKSKRKMKKYKIDTLKEDERKILKEYLISHSADSDKPQFAGEF